RQLVTLRTDAPVEFDLESAAVSKFRLERLIPILRELGFNRYQDEVKALLGQGATAETPAKTTAVPASGGGIAPSLFESAAETPARQVVGDYRGIKMRAELDDLVKRLAAAPIIAIDTETTSL